MMTAAGWEKKIVNVLMLLCLVVVGNLYPATGLPHRVRSIFSFGDSMIDAGNDHYKKDSKVRADFPPYGSTYFHHPTGRFTNGRNALDFLSELLGIKLQKPYLEAKMEMGKGSSHQKYYPSNGINFASAGSGVLPYTNLNLGVISLQSQLQNFQAILHQKKLPKKQVKNSLYLLESGLSDIYQFYRHFLTTNQTFSHNDYIRAMLKEVDKFIHKMYKLGARRIVVYSLGVLGCVPGKVFFKGAPTNIECFEEMNNMVEDFNNGLENLVLDMPNKYHGSIGVFADVYAIIQQLRATPKRYGFSNVSYACCGHGVLRGSVQCGKKGYELCQNPDEYLFWDSFHPSEHAYRLISNAIWGGEDEHARPYNLKTLVMNNINY